MSDSTIVNCTVLDVTPVRKGRLIALASVEIDIDGIVIVINGVRVFRYRQPGRADDFAGVGPPQFRDKDGVWRDAFQLPEEVEAVFADTVIHRCNTLGITDVKRTIATIGEARPSSIWIPK